MEMKSRNGCAGKARMMEREVTSTWRREWHSNRSKFSVSIENRQHLPLRDVWRIKLATEIRRMVNKSFHSSYTAIDDLLCSFTKL